jgi:hypothetical protein
MREEVYEVKKNLTKIIPLLVERLPDREGLR